jgi:hypothetical protein
MTATLADILALSTQDPLTGCWNWNRRCSPYGRAPAALLGRPAPAHKAAFIIAGGFVPAGFHVDHVCGNPRCVNPDHLDAVPLIINVQRGMLKGRAPICQRGHRVGGGRRLRSWVGRRGAVVCRTCLRLVAPEVDRMQSMKRAEMISRMLERGLLEAFPPGIRT